MKILGGTLPFQSGTREPGYNVKVGYYAQYRIEMLNTAHTVLQEVLDSPNPVSEQTARTVLGSFLFRKDDVFKSVGVLSGGEKSRLALVKLLLDPPNLLLMDEPTTHLDMASIDALIGALQQYEGTLIFISHDVYFIRSVASTVLHVNAGQLTPYAGDYQYYLDKSQAVSERAALTAGENAPVVAKPESQKTGLSMREIKEQKRRDADERQALARLRKEHQHRVAEIEAQILIMESRQKELTSQLEDPSTYDSPARALEINRELLGVTDSLERLTREWEKLAEAAPVGGAAAKSSQLQRVAPVVGDFGTQD